MTCRCGCGAAEPRWQLATERQLGRWHANWLRRAMRPHGMWQPRPLRTWREAQPRLQVCLDFALLLSAMLHL